MPVILARDSFQTWLRPDEGKPEEFQPLLIPYPPDEMQAYPVSTFVNSPKNNSPQCIQASAF
jgi:putative SOS response-associated peptidase YedK